ncbi:Endonuclease/exonuclease/phosphatase superfamily [Sesbania bispinosa]|nr:Endonuclease/exonuclease/phosphatase superfamily [Sesbania bispinosa]
MRGVKDVNSHRRSLGITKFGIGGPSVAAKKGIHNHFESVPLVKKGNSNPGPLSFKPNNSGSLKVHDAAPSLTSNERPAGSGIRGKMLQASQDNSRQPLGSDNIGRSRMGLSLKSQVKFQSVINAARKVGKVTELSILLHQGPVRDSLTRPPEMNHEVLATPTDVVVLNQRPPDSVEGAKATDESGCWFLWKEDICSIQILQSHSQFIHARVIPNDGSTEWFLTCVYGSPRQIDREALWCNLELLASLSSEAWMVVGDLNAYVSNAEKSGGAPPNVRSMSRFRDTLQVWASWILVLLVPLLLGSGVMLKNGWIELSAMLLGGSCSQKLVSHLPSFCSDHKVLCIDTSPVHNLSVSYSFKFLASWLEDNSFKNVVLESWGDNRNWRDAVLIFQRDVMEWNKQSFGNIFQKKRRVLARLEGINRCLSMNYHGGLQRLYKTLWDQYQSILLQEEAYWYHRARRD